MTTLKDAQKIAESLIDEYDNNWRDHHKDINKYLFPRRGRFLDSDTDSDDGKKRQNDIANTYPIVCCNTLASGLYDNLTSPAKEYFRLTTQDDELSDQDDVKEWLDEVKKRMYVILAASNYYFSVYEVYIELGAYCTSAMYIEEDFDYVVWFTTLTAGQYFIGVNRKGIVDRLARVFWLRSDDIVDEYGEENCSRAVVNDYNGKTKKKKFQVCHVVYPNPNHVEDSLMAKKKKFASVTYEYKQSEDGKILRHGGYDLFPFIVNRWATTGSESYGRGPGTDALAEVKGLQKLDDRGYRSLDSWVRPAWQVPTAFTDKTLHLHPGAINYYDASQVRAGATPINQTQPAFRDIDIKSEKVKAIIDFHFYKHLFAALTQDEQRAKTAYEVSKIEAERLSQLGSMGGRFDTEHIEALIDRLYFFMDKNGLIPPPPESIADGTELEVEHISPLAQAQKAAGAKGIEATSQFIGLLSQIDPKARYKLDSYEAIDEYHDMVGTPVRMVKSNDEANSAYAMEVQAQQQAMKMEQAQQAAEIAKTMAETPTGDQNTLLNQAEDNEQAQQGQ